MKVEKKKKRERIIFKCKVVATRERFGLSMRQPFHVRVPFNTEDRCNAADVGAEEARSYERSIERINYNGHLHFPVIRHPVGGRSAETSPSRSRSV